jgi:ketosteroid isomerase-like protein
MMKTHSTCTSTKRVDEASAKEWVETYFQYLKDGDSEAWYTLWDDDVTLLPPNQPPVYGLEAWKKMSEPGFHQYNNHHETIDLKLYADHDMAYVRWVGVAVNTPKSGGEALRNENKSVWLLRRGIDGSLKAFECIWSHNHPPRGDKSFTYEEHLK